MNSSVQPPPPTVAPGSRARRLRRSVFRHVGTALVIVGLGVLAWSFVVWKWNDPVTSVYTRLEQRELRRELDALSRREPQVVIPSTTSIKEARTALKRAAQRFKASAESGQALGRIIVPRLGVKMVMVYGTDAATLKKGPGLHPTTNLPGAGDLAYIAGHRTTYGAPFARIDRLRKGDVVEVEMPYATIRYRVSGHTIVDDNDLSVLRPTQREVLALQACHPRFFATERYIVWGDPVAAVLRDGREFSLLGPKP